MKVAAIFIVFALSSLIAEAECVEVTALKAQESSEFARIVVSVSGHPARGAQVKVYDRMGKAQVSASTDSVGQVSTQLMPGDYRVVATMSEDVTQSIELRVIHDHEPTTISVDLTIPWKQVEETLQRAESLPLQYRLRTFAGSVIDPSGAVISGANIKVLKKGATREGVALRVNSDEKGNFSGDLTEGLYVAFISAPGFRTKIVPLQITTSGSGIARVSLQVGSC